MKFFPLLALTALAALTGCETKYTRITSHNLEGTVTAEWIAEGYIQRLDQGYRIKAVERTSGPPVSTTTRYPNGWRTIVTGPTILQEPIPKPRWIAELDGEVPAEESTTTTVTTTHHHEAPTK